MFPVLPSKDRGFASAVLLVFLTALPGVASAQQSMSPKQRLNTAYGNTLLSYREQSTFGQKPGTLPEPLKSSLRELATIQIRVNTAYNDSESSLAFISHLINILPPKSERLRTDESLSGLILRIYGVSTYDQSAPSYLPKTYALLEHKILELNNTDASHLIAGPILCPHLPRKALIDVNPSLPANRIPHFYKFESILSIVDNVEDAKASDVISVSSEPVSRGPRTGAQTADLDVVLPPDAGRAVLNDPVLSPASTAPSFPIQATLAGPLIANSGILEDHSVLSATDRMTIQGLMSTRSVRDVPLFVLDTGWPNENQYNESRTDLNAILAIIWKTKLTGLTMPTVPDPPFADLAPNASNHCSIVQRSLSELEALDTNHHVKVVFVPLTQDQGSSDLLSLLLQTSYLLMYQAEHPNAPVDKSVFKRTKQNADSVIHSLQPAWMGQTVNTDKAIMDAVIWVGTAWAELKSTGFLVNESWTVPHLQYSVSYIEPPEGLVVAAAGNLGQNINVAGQAQVDFAQRCSTTTDTVAVMNLRPSDGLLCCSSTIDLQNIPNAMAVGFDGEVLGTNCADLCGTSFAAPRVAWIIAAGETMRSSTWNSSQWGLQIKNRIFAARQPSSTGLTATWFDAAKYLSILQ
jgi:hypothetical protein